MDRWIRPALALAVVLALAGAVAAWRGDDGGGPAPPAAPTGPWSGVPFAADTTGVLESPGGLVLPIAGVRADGSFDVQTPCDDRAVVASGTVRHAAHVVLDPGHGGSEPGAVGANGLLEKDLNLAVARRAADLLRAAGATVVLTRQGDERVTLATRAAIAVALRPVAFVSIHHNAAADGPANAPGTEVYFQFASADSQRLAGLLVEELRAALAPFGGPWESDSDNGAKARLSAESGDDYYGVLRRTAAGGVTGVLSEAGYLSNPVEAALFAREDVQQAEARAIADALTRFLEPAEAASAEAFATRPPATGGGGGSSGGPDGCVDPPLEQRPQNGVGGVEDDGPSSLPWNFRNAPAVTAAAAMKAMKRPMPRSMKSSASSTPPSSLRIRRMRTSAAATAAPIRAAWARGMGPMVSGTFTPSTSFGSTRRAVTPRSRSSGMIPKNPYPQPFSLALMIPKSASYHGRNIAIR